MRGAPLGPKFDLIAIHERDHGRCQLCRKRVRLDLAYPHPFSPSLDHIIPLAMGGIHEPANVQLAHLRCNKRKHVNACGEQLRLVG